MRKSHRTLKAEHLVLSLFKVKFFLWNLQSMLNLLLSQKVLELTHLKKKSSLYQWYKVVLLLKRLQKLLVRV
ncbi:MAG: hypothetical protein CMJ17_00290 [Phenylobacterium sp.]|nr:hypothetical protein [Phenylobacterium sp.]